ncbi:hypothetical protein NUZ5A_20227 [Candidatus Nitrosotenuis uzonensis]|uniref:Uncharacterized protein n=1 Tax=Candidatus Nitrosotenuis uzonensis TaxID=1407055 RepID=A0A812F426_9ARCH|nr:hypothetical protein NUZ5A_20227 [Candidatus Nitrosotenuis uzonensis]
MSSGTYATFAVKLTPEMARPTKIMMSENEKITISLNILE